MQAIKATARRQRASRVVAALQLFATTFVMHAIVGRYSRLLKMPRPDAYDNSLVRPKFGVSRMPFPNSNSSSRLSQRPRGTSVPPASEISNP